MHHLQSLHNSPSNRLEEQAEGPSPDSQNPNVDGEGSHLSTPPSILCKEGSVQIFQMENYTQHRISSSFCLLCLSDCRGLLTSPQIVLSFVLIIIPVLTNLSIVSCLQDKFQTLSHDMCVLWSKCCLLGQLHQPQIPTLTSHAEPQAFLNCP